MMSVFWKPGTEFNQKSSRLVIEDSNRNDDEHASSLIFNFHTGPIGMQRKSLPISKHRRQILYAMEMHSVLIIVGETGCGKSTQIPQYLYENGWCDEGFSVCVTQPRRIAAQSLAERVSYEMGCTLGELVGYTVRFDDVTTQSTAIRFVTDGVLLREAMLSDPLLSRYSVIMIDEAHERSLNTDALLGILRKIRRKRQDLRVIVCSATIDAESFLDFFIGTKNAASKRDNKREGHIDGKHRDNNPHRNLKSENLSDVIENGTILSVDGRQFPVDILYIENPVADYVQATVDTALAIHCDKTIGSDNGDILCFLPSSEDIDRAISIASESLSTILNGSHNKSQTSIDFLPLHSTLPYQMQSRIFRDKGSSEINRRVIFATNIAETSVTVPNISSVIDCGFVKMPFFDPVTGFDRLIICPISQASARQRAGRAGRIRNGKCYRLYSEAAMSKIMQATTPPEILRSNLASFLLTIKALGVQNILSFDLMSIPSVEALSRGLETLYALGAIDDEVSLTTIGNQMAEFPTSVYISKMLLESIKVGCVKDTICVAAAMQVKSLFYQPKNQRQQNIYDKAMSEVVDSSGDHMTYAKLVDLYDLTPLTEDECKERFINFVALKRLAEVRSQLTSFMKRYGGNCGTGYLSEKERSIAIRKCVTAGFFSNVGKLANDGRYYSLRGKHMISISGSSVLKRFGECTEYIIFCETYDGNRGGIEVRSCSSIEGKWLRELVPHYWQ